MKPNIERLEKLYNHMVRGKLGHVARNLKSLLIITRLTKQPRNLMQNLIIKNHFDSLFKGRDRITANVDGFECMLVSIADEYNGVLNHGDYNGYVALPENHPAIGRHYNVVSELYNIHVHGGLTFSQHITDEKGKIISTIFGFDTLHYGDGPHLDKKWCLNETLKLAHQFKKINRFNHHLFVFKFYIKKIWAYLEEFCFNVKSIKIS